MLIKYPISDNNIMHSISLSKEKGNKLICDTLYSDNSLRVFY